MKLYSYIWNERGTSKEQGGNKTLDIALGWKEDDDKQHTKYPYPIENRIQLTFYRSVEGEIVLRIGGNNRIRVEDKRK